MGSRISMRDLRAHLKAHLERQEPVLVGSEWKLRAIIIPVPEFSSWDKSAERKALAELRKRWAKAIDLAFPD